MIARGWAPNGPCLADGVAVLSDPALAPGPWVLIAARAVQGLGASALLPCSLALLVHRFPDRRERARALGVWGGMGSLGVSRSARWPAGPWVSRCSGRC